MHTESIKIGDLVSLYPKEGELLNIYEDTFGIYLGEKTIGSTIYATVFCLQFHGTTFLKKATFYPDSLKKYRKETN